MIPFKFHLKNLLVSNSWFIEGFIKDLFRNERRIGKCSSVYRLGQ